MPPKKSSSGNSWNSFQAAHAGQGLSRSEMSALYQSSKSGGSSSYSARTGQSSSTNSWNDFQHNHSGLGLSRAEMSALYQTSKSGGDSSVSRSNQTLSWNDFQHQHAGEGLSRSEMSALYQQSKTSSSASSSTGLTNRYAGMGVTSSSSSPRSPNQWNEFQRAHAGQGLTKAEMVAKYKDVKKKGKLLSPNQFADELASFKKQLQNYQQTYDPDQQDTDRYNFDPFELVEEELEEATAFARQQAWVERQKAERHPIRTQPLIPLSTTVSGTSSNSSESTSQTHRVEEIPRSNVTMDIKDFVGEGGFGKVYRATWCGATVAVKVVQTVHRKDRTSFATEVKTMSKLHHPNVVQFFGFMDTNDINPGALAIVMEFMDGGSLYSNLHISGRVTWSSRTKQHVIHEILLGLGYLHSDQVNIAHRDLKTMNILLDMRDPPSVKLTDFGLALYRSQATLTSSNVKTRRGPVGTLMYMAPEVIQGELSESNIEGWKRADVYATAIIMAEIVGEDYPYRGVGLGANGSTLLRRVREGLRPEALLDNPTPTPPSALISLIRRAWDKDPAKRPTTKDILAQLPQWQ